MTRSANNGLSRENAGICEFMPFIINCLNIKITMHNSQVIMKHYLNSQGCLVPTMASLPCSHGPTLGCHVVRTGQWNTHAHLLTLPENRCPGSVLALNSSSTLPSCLNSEETFQPHLQMLKLSSS
jgi:hypothetical protein